jgi:ASPIC and UnbV
MVLGLGARTKVDWVEVKWPGPSGKTERFSQLPVDKYITITEGDGSAVNVSAIRGLQAAEKDDLSREERKNVPQGLKRVCDNQDLRV